MPCYICSPAGREWYGSPLFATLLKFVKGAGSGRPTAVTHVRLKLTFCQRSPFPPSLDTWNQPWFACQMVSISLPLGVLGQLHGGFQCWWSVNLSQSNTGFHTGLPSFFPFTLFWYPSPAEFFNPNAFTCLRGENAHHNRNLQAYFQHNLLCSAALLEHVQKGFRAKVKLPYDVFNFLPFVTRHH